MAGVGQLCPHLLSFSSVRLESNACQPSFKEVSRAAFFRGSSQLVCKQSSTVRSKVRFGKGSQEGRTMTTCNAAVSAGSDSALAQKVDFKKLQNGSDIRGVALEGVEGEPVTLTEPITEAIAAGFAGWLLDKKNIDGFVKLKISIGHDSRITAKSMQSAAARGIAGAGLDVVLYGLASTPAMFNSTMTVQDDLLCPVDGAIMLTASHLPYNRNGLKFFTNAGGLGKADISDILSRASKIYDKMSDKSREVSQSAAEAVVSEVDYMERYTQDLVEAVRKGAGGVEKPLEGFHIVVDAGNGAGGFFAGKVLEPLGAVTTGSQFLDPDGMFPNHIPNPEDKKAMEAIKKAVLEQKADLGIIFDTDVDRSAAVDSSGRELNRNRLIALMAAIVLEEHPGTTIVTDSVTSDGLTTFIEKKLGGKHHRFKRGYKNVIDEGIRLNQIGEECHLAIETSGHGALKENHWLDDGAYTMVKLLIKLAAAKVSGEGSGSEVLSNLIGELKEADFASELRFKINQEHPDLGSGTFREYGEQVMKKLESMVELDSTLQKAPVNHEGVRVSGFGGWFLLRLSLHDPVLPLNIEAPSKEAAAKLGNAVLAAVQDFKALDISPLQKLLTSVN
ncbi:hypothetical protein MPTK1_4g11210 [Marchantia polymorpha subsp. ruderalis]|uniref:phosphoglucomutase (alpha-D-glucose-1,6-bisphosphate-dependent) n=2 Tax=Marchantia polymorpha TaxID=3197 RepID=A0AAF6B8Q8_MARPO|nr:hypothetical protein MARPO_0011s0106 [Marchantia polymorpha]BBN08392.1 hypothetical protein Mp_4g11210 [Marchantia polymorpha subsp. ruderalis]|eukprot:PTQ46428.1 hypothetical protein MARPO_0011s0106 [Marchantia polymorpha]